MFDSNILLSDISFYILVFYFANYSLLDVYNKDINSLFYFSSFYNLRIFY